MVSQSAVVNLSVAVVFMLFAVFIMKAVVITCCKSQSCTCPLADMVNDSVGDSSYGRLACSAHEHHYNVMGLEGCLYQHMNIAGRESEC